MTGKIPYLDLPAQIKSVRREIDAALGHKPGDFPVAEKAAREILSLPMFLELTSAQIQRVAEAVKNFFKK